MQTPTLVAAVLAAATLFPAAIADAQIVRSYGVTAEITSSDVRSPEVSVPGGPSLDFETERRIGVGLAGFVEFNTAGPMSVVTEVGYAQRGYAWEIDVRDAQNNPQGTTKLNERFDFLSLDAALKFRHAFSWITPYALAGPEVRFKLGGNGPLSDPQSGTTYGLTSGIGAELMRGTGLGFLAEIRYAVDLSNSLPDVPRDIYHNAIDIRMGVRF